MVSGTVVKVDGDSFMNFPLTPSRPVNISIDRCRDRNKVNHRCGNKSNLASEARACMALKVCI
jgi:hypothetical protein